MKRNKLITFASRPTGYPSEENFSLQEKNLPDLNPGQYLAQNRFISIDPYIRGKMNEVTGYSRDMTLGQVVEGGTVARVIESRNSSFPVGTDIFCYGGWQEYVLLGEEDIVFALPPGSGSEFLNGLGLAGFTAYLGLFKVLDIQAGRKIAICGAGGAVGSLAAQIAKISGCEVTCITGSEAKKEYLQNELQIKNTTVFGSSEFTREIQKFAGTGFDYYFCNVGGDIFSTILFSMKKNARIVLSGLSAIYNDNLSMNQKGNFDLALSRILHRTLDIKGFMAEDYGDSLHEFSQYMSPHLQSGTIKTREQVYKGLELAPQAFIDLMHRKNMGKCIVDLSQS